MVTTFLDLLGILLVLLALGLVLASWVGIPLALAICGAVVLGVSWAIDRGRK